MLAKIVTSSYTHYLLYFPGRLVVSSIYHDCSNSNYLALEDIYGWKACCHTSQAMLNGFEKNIKKNVLSVADKAEIPDELVDKLVSSINNGNIQSLLDEIMSRFNCKSAGRHSSD